MWPFAAISLINLKSVLWKFPFKVMLCYQKNSQKGAVEIQKLKENRYSFPLSSCFLCLLLEILFFVISGTWNASFFAALMRSSKESVIYLKFFTLIVTQWWLPLEFFWHIFMKDGWKSNETQKEKMDRQLIVKSWTHFLPVPGALKCCFGKMSETTFQIVRGIYETSRCKSTQFLFPCPLWMLMMPV